MTLERVILNVQTNDVDCAAAANDRYPGRIAVGVPVKGFDTVADAVTVVEAMQRRGVRVSAGLGDGAADQWRRAHDLAVATRPYHLNQVYPAAGYSAGALAAAGATTIVNALLRPGSTVGTVRIGTGPRSTGCEQPDVPVELAVALVHEIGLPSVKFFPMRGLEHLDHYRALAAAAAPHGLMVEPTGGLTPDNLRPVLAATAAAGLTSVMPHLYSSVKLTGTDLLDLAALDRAMAVADEFSADRP
jgi:2-dehydro-3-deoxy-phosphogluconate aldolase